MKVIQAKLVLWYSSWLLKRVNLGDLGALQLCVSSSLVKEKLGLDHWWKNQATLGGLGMLRF